MAETLQDGWSVVAKPIMIGFYAMGFASLDPSCG